jgi:hypothetical protein
MKILNRNNSAVKIRDNNTNNKDKYSYMDKNQLSGAKVY